MDKRIDEVRSLKTGRYILIDDLPCRVTSITHSKPGKHGGAKAKIDAIGVFNNQKKSIIKPAGDKVEVPVIEKKVAQVLNVINDRIQLMDLGSYETFELEIPEEEELKASANQGAEIIYIEAGGNRKIFQVKSK